jgi:hypothetical protein
MSAATCGDKPNPECRFAHPGYACCAKALGITIKHHESSLARPPIALQARPGKPTSSQTSGSELQKPSTCHGGAD